MYYPYLRAKETEIQAVLDTRQGLGHLSGIRPIFEPVKKSQMENLQGLVATGLDILVIDNPLVGDYKAAPKDLRDELKEGVLAPKNVVPAFILKSNTSKAMVDAFRKRYPGRAVSFVHRDTVRFPEWLAGLGARDHIFLNHAPSYRSVFAGSEVVNVQDHFVKRVNANYIPEELFSTDLATPKVSFGDYSIVGDTYHEGYGRARAVALHLMCDEGQGELVVRHFVSSTNGNTGRLKLKYDEAVKKLIDHLDKVSDPKTLATEDIRDRHAVKRRPGLTGAKRLGIQHHLELVTRHFLKPKPGAASPP